MKRSKFGKYKVWKNNELRKIASENLQQRINQLKEITVRGKVNKLSDKDLLPIQQVIEKEDKESSHRKIDAMEMKTLPLSTIAELIEQCEDKLKQDQSELKQLQLELVTRIL